MPTRVKEVEDSCGKDAVENADCLYRAGDYCRALEIYRQVCKRDPHDANAACRASEAALLLEDYSLAKTLAENALEIDPGQSVARTVLVRAFAHMNQESKAVVFVADLENVTVTEKNMLFQAIAAASPTCSELRDGLIVTKAGPSQYVAVSTVAIPAGACLCKEAPFLRWTKTELQDPAAMKLYLQSPKEYVDRTEGLFPRSFDDCPFHLEVFQDLSERIRLHMPNASEAEVQRWMMSLARVKMCAFESGLHHFTAFIDHSCSPNCEVRGEATAEIFALRDIAAGEALRITYYRELDYPAPIRRDFLHTNFGFDCACLRCLEEDALAASSKAAEVTEESFLEFQMAVVGAFNAATEADPMYCDIAAGNLAGWRESRWKTADVLGKLSQAYGEHIEHAEAAAAAASSSGLGAAAAQKAAAEAACEPLEAAGALGNLARLYEIRAGYFCEASYMMDGLRDILKGAVRLYLRAGRASAAPGFDTPGRLEAVRRRCRDGVGLLDELRRGGALPPG